MLLATVTGFTNRLINTFLSLFESALIMMVFENIVASRGQVGAL
jgi:hypothetical protein